MKIKLMMLLLLISMKNYGKDSDSLQLFENSTEVNKSRVHLLNYTVAGLYPLSMSWLYTQWYKDYPQSSFHFFNDNAEWLQMDKFGHTWDAYNISKPLFQLYSWAGHDNKKATLTACGISFLFQSTVEVFDGFSSEWGFSTGDILGNTTGVLLFGAQQLAWQEQRIKLKYSFHQTNYSSLRPDLLGSNLPENILKDYNGLTYWLSVNPSSFIRTKNKFPKWLGVAFGFGADGLLGGINNPEKINGKVLPVYERYRQYYLSFDIELSKIKTNSKFFNGIFRLVNIIHIPAPTVEFSPGRKAIGRLLYF